MVGGFFPTPYPDECLYSILCRYCVRAGYTVLKPIQKALFGGQQQCLASSIFFPIRLDMVERWYGADSGISRKLIAEKHTMHPYIAIVYPEKFRRQTDAVINGADLPKTFDKTGTQRSHRLWPKYLRCCPDCVRDDVAAYGETYWHRVQQLPAMMYCMKHHVRLRESGVEVIGSRMGFCPASAEPMSEYSGGYDTLAPHKEKFIRIGLESEWLLKNGSNIDWGFDLHQKYKRHFRDKGIATVQGISDYDLIADAFETYWGKDFLDCLRTELSDNREWIRQIYEARMTSFRPVYHILLMCFLCGSVEAFLDYAPQESIFGNSPWACMNTLCDHHDVDGVETVDIHYLNGVATGFFKCKACGMVYKRRYWRKRLSPRYIVEYGEVWTDRMIRCLRDEKFDIPTTAKVLNCKPHTVRWQMKKLGILGNPEYLRRPRTYDGEIGAEETYKAQVLALCGQYEEVTFDILKLYAPKAYRYLYKFDSSWLHEHITLSANSKRHRDEDAEMLLRVQNAVAAILSDGMPTRQITHGFIAVTAGYKEPALQYLADKRPLTKAYIDKVAESRTDWMKRRITAIAQERRQYGKKISIADIKREMSLKPNTFVKYEKFLKELMNELNDNMKN